MVSEFLDNASLCLFAKASRGTRRAAAMELQRRRRFYKYFEVYEEYDAWGNSLVSRGDELYQQRESMMAYNIHMAINARVLSFMEAELISTGKFHAKRLVGRHSAETNKLRKVIWEQYIMVVKDSILNSEIARIRASTVWTQDRRDLQVLEVQEMVPRLWDSLYQFVFRDRVGWS